MRSRSYGMSFGVTCRSLARGQSSRRSSSTSATRSTSIPRAIECGQASPGGRKVNHGYGGSVQDTIEKLQYEFFYIKVQSLRLDLLILFATVRTILSGAGK